MFKSRVEGSEVISSYTDSQKTLEGQQSVKAVDGGHSCGIWAPWSIIKSPYNLGHHLKCFGQGLDVQKSSVNAQSVRNPKSQLLVNCPFNQWFDDGIGFERVISCPNRPHISCQTPSWKNLKPDQKFPKMETGPVTETYQKWKVLILKLTSWYKLQMNFCPTWKLKILFSHFQKVQELSNPMYGCQDMIQSFSPNFELQLSISLKP